MTTPPSDPPAATPDASPGATPTVTTMRRGWLLVLLLGLGLAAVVALGLAVTSGSGGATLEVVVPAGTAQRMEAGDRIELLPAILRVDVGDELVITNDDTEVHLVGPYVVAPGQTVRQQFTTAGRIEGVCTLHPDGEIAILVS